MIFILLPFLAPTLFLRDGGSVSARVGVSMSALQKGFQCLILY
jgi:hypothetical protein